MKVPLSVLLTLRHMSCSLSYRCLCFDVEVGKSNFRQYSSATRPSYAATVAQWTQLDQSQAWGGQCSAGIARDVHISKTRCICYNILEPNNLKIIPSRSIFFLKPVADKSFFLNIWWNIFRKLISLGS